MDKTVVAVVGRPNVGKSSFFNYVAGERISIVHSSPGVTRDRIYQDVSWLDQSFTLIDTGGIEPNTKDNIFAQMAYQVEIAIEVADIILFMVDGKTGLHPADKDIANRLRKTNKPVIVAVNKCDNVNLPDSFYEFYELGFEHIMPISAAQGLGIGNLLDLVLKLSPEKDNQTEESQAIKVALVGKPNVGKSSLLNRLANEKRSIVTDIPGTTRDTIHTPISNEYGDYIFLDTAGLRRKSKIKDKVERYSTMRSTSAISACDVCIIMIDASEGPTTQDTKIAGLAHDLGKACIICVNKWDLPADEKRYGFEDMTLSIRNTFSFMPYAELIFISAQKGTKVDKLFELINDVYANYQRKIRTSDLNNLILDLQEMQQAPSFRSKRLKIYYATQVAVKPPTFTLFVNDPQLVHFSYERYIENQFRYAFDFHGTPLKILYRKKT